MSMNMNMPKTVYWYKNQVAIMYQTDLSPQAPTIAEKVTSFRKQLNSQVLDKFNLLPYSVVSVQPPMQQEVANAAVEVDDLDGVYLFGAPKIGIDQRDRTAIIIFYHVAPKPDSMQQENTGMNGMGNDGMVDNTLAVIDQLQKNRSVLQHMVAPSVLLFLSRMAVHLESGSLPCSSFPIPPCKIKPVMG